MTYLYLQPTVYDLPNDTLHGIADGDLPPGRSIRCGNRTDLPKKDRQHIYVHLGTEIRNTGTSAGYLYGELYACRRCGADRFRKWKGPKLQAVAEFCQGVRYRCLEHVLARTGLGE